MRAPVVLVRADSRDTCCPCWRAQPHVQPHVAVGDGREAEEGKLDADGLYQTCRENHISMCGMLPAVVVMKTLERLDSLKKCQGVGYATSADVSGDKSRVVGYAGVLLN